MHFTAGNGAFVPSHEVPTARILVMTRMLFVEDLVPGDRISIDGIKACTQAGAHGETQRLIELAHSSDSTDMIVDVGVKIEVF